MPLSRHRCVEVAAPYKLRINKIVQTSRADDIRPYAIMLIYNKKELRTAVPFCIIQIFTIYPSLRGGRAVGSAAE